MKEKHLYSFGEFSLNVEDQTLSRNGENVPLTPKMFDLLLVFVQNPKKVLRKDFLMKSVWPDSFVEEGNITFNIRQIRKALNDDAQSPIFIETIPRRGYRFLQPVEAFTTVTPDKSEEDIAAAQSAPEPVPAERSRPYVFITIGAVVLVGALLIAGWLVRERAFSTAPILSAPFSLEKLSTDGGVFHIVISPDGKNVFYTSQVNGKQSIWLRQLETGNNVQIVPESDDFYGGLAIAPDGQTIFFARGGLGVGLTTYRMSIFGGVPQRIADGTQGWISVSGNGERVSYVRCKYSDDDYCSLYVADAADGKNEKLLARRPRPIRIGDNQLSPDGKTVAFAVGQSRTSSNDFAAVAVDVETGVERELTAERFFNINYFTWLSDQSGVLMTAKQLPDLSYSIWQVSNSGTAKRLTSDSETYSRLSMDAANRVLVSTQVKPDFRLMVYQTDNPTAPPIVLGEANSVSFAGNDKLFFSSTRTGNSEIWSINSDGTELRQLTNENSSSDSVPVTSTDLKTVFFVTDRTGTNQVWKMDADGANQRQLTTDEGGTPLQISPDGKWLYYRSGLKGTLRRVDVDGGQEEQVLGDTGRGLTVSPNLKYVAYSVRQGPETILYMAKLETGEVEKTWRIAGPANIEQLRWSSTSDYLAYVLGEDGREFSQLWFLRIADTSPKQIADLSGNEIRELASFSLSADGKKFAVIRGSWKHDAVLIRGLK